MTSIILFDFLIFGLTIRRNLHTLKVMMELRTTPAQLNVTVLLVKDGKRFLVLKSVLF